MVISECRNVLFEGGVFEVENIGLVHKIEVWNYDSRRRLGMLLLGKMTGDTNF
jgi:hypothetical protein